MQDGSLFRRIIFGSNCCGRTPKRNLLPAILLVVGVVLVSSVVSFAGLNYSASARPAVTPAVQNPGRAEMNQARTGPVSDGPAGLSVPNLKVRLGATLPAQTLESAKDWTHPPVPVVSTATDPTFYLQEGATLSSLDDGATSFTAAYMNVTMPQSSPYSIGYEFNVLSNTGDWYQVVLTQQYWPQGLCSFSYVHDSFEVWNNAGSSVVFNCDLLDNPSPGDNVALYVYVATSGQVCMEVYDWTNTANSNADCENQPDPGTNPTQNYFVLLPYSANFNGYFTGPMTEVPNYSSSTCSAIPGMPLVSYDWGGVTAGSGFDVAQYVPWSDQFYSSNFTLCYFSPYTPPIVVANYGILTAYFDAAGNSAYGPHWVAGQEMEPQWEASAPIVSGWRFQTDVSPLSSPTVGATSTDLDYGEATTLSSTTPTGGVSPYTYDWQVPGGGAGNPFHWIPPYAGNYSAFAYIQDELNDINASSQVVVQVHPDPRVTSLTASPNGSVDVGQVVKFSVTVADGIPPYSFSWDGLPKGCPSESASVVTCTAVSNGTLSVRVLVVDSQSWDNLSRPLTFTIYSDPLASMPSANRTSADVNQSVAFTVGPSGGSGNYTYSWSGLPGNCVGLATRSPTCTVMTVGDFSIVATVMDSNGAQNTSIPLKFSVFSDPTVSTPSASPRLSEVGQPVTFSAFPSGGSGVYNFAWSGLPGNCQGTSTADPACLPELVGIFPVSVIVTDSSGFSVTSGLLDYNVTIGPSVSGLTASHAHAIDVGQSVTFSASATGGTGIYSFDWRGLPSNCSSPAGPVVTCEPTTPSTFNISVSVTDSLGASNMSGVLAFSVYSDPTIGSSMPLATSSSSDVGQNVTFTVRVSGGFGEYTYQWSGLPPGCDANNASTVSCRPTAPGTYSVLVSVADSNGFTVTTASRSYITYADPSISSFVTSAGSILEGSQATLSVATANGKAPLTYEYSGLPPGCNSVNATTLSCTPSSTGKFTIVVDVTDANGFRTQAQTTLTVSPSFIGLPASEGYAVVGGSIAAALLVAAVVSLVVLRRRKRRAPPTPFEPQPPPPPGAS